MSEYKRPEDYWCNNEEQVKIIEAALDLYENSLRPGQWIDVNERLPADGEEVLLYHCLGDSRRGDHARDVASYINGKWIFPWDRGELNPRPRWPVAWAPLPAEPL